MDINDIKHLAVERIYLVPDASEGQLGYAWFDDPAPGVDMDPSEAVEYVRKDVHDAEIAQLESKRHTYSAQADELETQADFCRDAGESSVAFRLERRVAHLRKLAEESA